MKQILTDSQNELKQNILKRAIAASDDAELICDLSDTFEWRLLEISPGCELNNTACPLVTVGRKDTERYSDTIQHVFIVNPETLKVKVVSTVSTPMHFLED